MMKKFAVGLLSGFLVMSVGHAFPWSKKPAPVQTQQGVGNPVPQQGMGVQGMQNRLPISMQPRPMGQGGGTCPALPMKDFTSLLTKGMVVSSGVNLKKVSMNKGGAGKQILSFFGKQKDYPGTFVSAAQVNGVVARDHITIDQKTGGTQVPNAGFCVYQHNPGKVPEFLLAAISTEPVTPTPPKGGVWGQIANQTAQQVKGIGQNTAQQLVGVGQNTLQQGMMAGQNTVQQGMMAGQNAVQKKVQPYVQPQQQMPQQQMGGYNQMQMPQQPQPMVQGGYPNQGQYPQGGNEYDQYGGQDQYPQGGNEYDQYGSQDQYSQGGNEYDQYGGQDQYQQGGNEYDQYGGQDQYPQGGNEYDQYGGQDQYQQQGNGYNQQYGY